MTANEQDFLKVQFIMKFFWIGVTIQMKAIELYFPIMLYKVLLTFQMKAIGLYFPMVLLAI